VTEEHEGDPDLLRDTAENLLGTAERCYRLARGTADLQKVRERLPELAREFEVEPKDARTPARR
jgi:hypothetical protein